MIAAVSGASDDAAVKAIATKLGNAGGGGVPPEVGAAGASHVAVMAWPGVSSRIDCKRGLAWTGRITGQGLVGALPTEVGDLGGTFSVAATTGDRLVLARSLFGGRSMYFARDAGHRALVACSRLGPLAGSLSTAPALDVTRLAALVLGVPALDERSTIFDGIRRVVPGETLSFGYEGDIFRSRAALIPLDAAPRDWASELRGEFERAVSRATSGCKRVAILLSGGLDSSAVFAALVARERGASAREVADIMAITLDFDASHSDRPYLDSLAKAYGIVPVRVAPNECASHAFSSLVIDGAPRAWPSAAMEVHLLEVARAGGADVVLSGVGGDFFFDLEFISFGERALAGDVFGAAWDAASLRAVYWKPTKRGRIGDFVIRPLIRGMLPPRLLRGLRRMRGRASRRGPEWAGPALRRFAAEVHDAAIASEPARGRGARMNELAQSSVFADIADALTQIEVYSGCREEHLYFDADFARFLASIPSDVVLQDGWLRGVVRAAFRDGWPECIRAREDKGDFEPAFAAFLAGLRASGELDRLLRMEALGDLGLVEPRRFRESFEQLTSDPDNGGAWTRHWPALAVEEFASRRDLATIKRIGMVA